MVDVQHGVRIYHWKHGWIPLDHFAAMKKAHGSFRGAQKALDKAHAEGHAHRSFAETGTHRGGSGAGSHLRRADGFQPVANEHLRRDKHIVAAFHENSRQFHLLDLERKHSAVISEADARQIHMDGHKIVGISKSESGGTQIKVMNMANGRVHRIDAVSDGLSKQLKPDPAKPAPKRNAFAEAGAREAQRKADALAFAKAEKEREAADRAARAPKPATEKPRGAFAQAGAREAQRKADAQAFAKAEREREAADRAARAAKGPSKTHETVAVPGTPREERAGRFKAAQAERAKAFQAQHAAVGPSNQQKIDNAAKMYGAGSPQHREAQRRFGSEQHAGIVDGRAEREAAAARADAKRAAMKAENEAKAKAEPKRIKRIAAQVEVGDNVKFAVNGKNFTGTVEERRLMQGAHLVLRVNGEDQVLHDGHPVHVALPSEHGFTAADRVARNLAAIQAKNAMAEGNAGNHREAADLYGKAAQQFDRAGEKAAGDAARALADHHQRVLAAKAGAKPSAPKADVLGQHRAAIAGAKNVGDIEKVKADVREAFLNGQLDRLQHNKLQAEAIRQHERIREGQGIPQGARALEPDLQRRVDAGQLGGARANEINQGRYARELQIKGNRLRNVDRIQEHRAHVAATPNIQERHREILLKQIDRKLGNNERVAQRKAQEAGRAAEQARQDREAFAGGATEKHFENGGSILSAPQHRLMDYIRANPQRFEVKRFSKNGNISDSYKVTDKQTGEVAWHKDDGQARYGAIKEKLAGDVGNALGFFDHKVNLDVGADGKPNHVFIGNAPGVEGFGENNRFKEASVGEGIRKGSDPASFMRMVMHDYLIANDEDRHYMNFHVVNEGGGKMRAAILDHGRGFGGAGSSFHNAPVTANFNKWFEKYKVHSARGWDAVNVARAAYPQDHEASQAYDQIVGRMKQVNVEDVIKQAFSAPGVNLPPETQAQWENLIRGRYAHLVDPKNKAGIIQALKGA